MKSIITIVTTLSIITMLFAQCKKQNTTFHVYCYTNMNASGLTLYIDDELKGEIPYLITDPTCDNDSLKQQCLHLSLESGKHDIVAKDAEGNVKSSSELKIKTGSLSTSGNMGGLEANLVDDCLLLGLYY